MLCKPHGFARRSHAAGSYSLTDGVQLLRVDLRAWFCRRDRCIWQFHFERLALGRVGSACVRNAQNVWPSAASRRSQGRSGVAPGALSDRPASFQPLDRLTSSDDGDALVVAQWQQIAPVAGGDKVCGAGQRRSQHMIVIGVGEHDARHGDR